MNRLAVVFFLVSSLVFSQKKDSLKSYRLNEITIESGLVLQPKSTINISSKDISLSDAASLDKIAPLLPSVKVQTNSRGETLFYLRNSGKRRIILMLDGIPLNVPWDNRIDLSLIPTAAISRITITKGIPSVIYGPNALGGVINVSTMNYEGNNRGEISLSGGESGRKNISGYYLSNIGSVGVVVSGGYNARNAYPLPESFHSSANPGSDRINSYSKGYNLFFKVNKKFSDNSNLGVSVSYLNREKGVPPQIGVNKIRYWQYPELSDLSVSLGGKLNLAANGNSFVTYSANFTKYRSVINQYTSASYSVLDAVEHGDDFTYFGRAIYTALLGSSAILKVAFSGFNSKHDEMITENFSSGAGTEITKNTYSQNVFSIGTEYERTLKNLVLNAGLSFDGSSTPLSGDKPAKEPTYDYGFNAGGVYTFNENFNARVSLGRKTRFPTMREMFSGALGKFEVNPELHAETAQSGEIGLQYNCGSTNLEADIFLTYIKDGIVRTKLSSGKYKRINKSEIRNYGIETELETELLDDLDFRVNASLINTRGRNDKGEFADTLEYSPGIIAGAGLIYYFDNFGFLFESNYIGNEFEEQKTLVKLPDYVIADFRVTYKIKFSTFEPKIFFRVNNITDKLYYTQFGLPEAGREFIAGVKMKF